MNMNMRSKTIIIVATGYCLIFAGLLFSGVYLISVEGTKLETTKVLLAEQTAKEEAYTKVTKLVESTKISRTQLKSFFITENETIAFLTSIEKAAEAIGVTLKTNELAVIPVVVADGVTTPAALTLRFTFSGSEAAVKKFLTLLEQIPYHVVIPKVTMNTSEANWKVTADLRITLLP